MTPPRSGEEMVAFLSHIGLGENEDDLKKALDALDGDNSGEVSFEEFIEYAEKKKLDNIPNLGKGSIALLETRLAEQGYVLPKRLRSRASLLRDRVQAKREARYAKYRQIMQWREEQRSIKWIAREVDMSYGGVLGILHRFLANPGALDGKE